MLEDFRNVGRAQERKPEMIRVIAGLVERCSAHGERLGVEGGVAAIPEKGSVGLGRIEVAEVTTSAEATSTSTASTTGATAKTSRTTPAISTAPIRAAAGRLRERLVELVVVHILPHLIHIDSGEGIGGAALPADGDRIAGEVGITGERGQLRVGAAVAASSLNQTGGSTEQAEILRSAAGILPQILRNLCGLIGAFLRGGARGKREHEIGLLIVRSRVE